MNLAEATAKLRQKESEKMTLLAEIAELETRRSEGCTGSVTVTLLRVKGDRSLTNYTLSVGSRASESAKLGEEITVPIRENDDVLSLVVETVSRSELSSYYASEPAAPTSTPEPSSEDAAAAAVVGDDAIPAEAVTPEVLTAVEVQPVAEEPAATAAASAAAEEESAAITISQVHVATIDLRTLPRDTYLKTDIDAVSSTEQEAKVALEVKVAYNSILADVTSKQAELDQVYKEMEAVKEAVSARGKATAASAAAAKKPAAKKASKKTSKGPSSKAAAGAGAGRAERQQQGQDDVDESSTDASAPSIMETVVGTVVASGQFVFQHYAVVLFAVASTGIYYYGDNASI